MSRTLVRFQTFSNHLRLGLDRLMIINIFAVFGCAFWFVLAVLLHAQSIEKPLKLLNKLWEPLFIPIINLFILGIITSSVIGWWQQKKIFLK